jgi:8-oxo-dGTP pyrophosphatase MutT (NUDIX family)
MSVPVSKFRVAIYGVLTENGSVLMTETKIPSGTAMNFPGGGLELGESPVKALKREFLEETGCAVEIEELLYASQDFQQNPDYPTEQLMHLYYRVRKVDDSAFLNGNQDDVVATAWITPQQIPQLRIMPVDEEFIKSAVFSGLFK